MADVTFDRDLDVQGVEAVTNSVMASRPGDAVCGRACLPDAALPRRPLGLTTASSARDDAQRPARCDVHKIRVVVYEIHVVPHRDSGDEAVD